MNQTHAQTPLAGPLRARINRLAHSHALHHEARMKASLLEQVQTARDGGTSFAELAAMLAKLEATPPGGVGGLQSSALTRTGHHTVSHAQKIQPL